MIHNDIWGLSRTKNISRSRWFVTFIDDHTRLTWIFLMIDKFEVDQIFINFHKMIQNKFQAQIQILKTDNGREYFHSALNT